MFSFVERVWITSPQAHVIVVSTYLGWATMQPEEIVIDEAKAKDWLSKGVQPTDTVKTLLIRQGIMEKPTKLSAPRTKTRKKK